MTNSRILAGFVIQQVGSSNPAAGSFLQRVPDDAIDPNSGPVSELAGIYLIQRVPDDAIDPNSGPVSELAGIYLI